MHPGNGKLTKDKNGVYSSSIVDIELDLINCKFKGEDCVELDTDTYTYVCLTRDNLYKLIDLMDEAEEKMID